MAEADGNAFQVFDNKELRAKQAEGLAAAQTGTETGEFEHFVVAHARFSEARALLPPRPGGFSVGIDDSNILRDDAFTTTREAILTDGPEERDHLFRRAQGGLYRARLAAYNANLSPNPSTPGLRMGMSVREEQQQRASLGATIGLMARTATAHAVLLDQAGHGIQRDHEFATARRCYTEADGLLADSDNVYFGASNASNALASEWYQGVKAAPNIARWAGRVMYWYARALRERNDHPEDSRGARRTIQRNVRKLGDKAELGSAILAHP